MRAYTINTMCIICTFSAVMNDDKPAASLPHTITLVTSFNRDGLSDDVSDHVPLTT
jgi:hypothetical protein